MELCQTAKKGVVKTAACSPRAAFPAWGEEGLPAAFLAVGRQRAELARCGGVISADTKHEARLLALVLQF